MMTIIKKHGWWVAMVMLIALVAAFAWIRFYETPNEEITLAPCADIVAGCALPVSGGSARFDRQPETMQPFRITVIWPGVSQVHASFQMDGMEMGFNRYKLIAAEAGTWRGEVTLPACIRSRKDWQMILEADGRKIAMPFTSH
ncbi:MAG: hypothetical protein LBE24_09625 [Methylobacillus sp.]|nr:hypothetical protein [Methylobacillus sp.]